MASKPRARAPTNYLGGRYLPPPAPRAPLSRTRGSRPPARLSPPQTSRDLSRGDHRGVRHLPDRPWVNQKGAFGPAAVLSPRAAAKMFCSISGTTPEEPVISAKTGHLFERSLITKALQVRVPPPPRMHPSHSEAPHPRSRGFTT
jgi:hypothetical protein